MKKIIAFFLLCFVLFGANPSIDNLELLTEEFPPLNFSKDSKVYGLSVDILEEVLKECNSKLTRKDIKIMPWSRAYNIAQTSKNKLIFSMVETPERKKIFKFVGPFYKTKVGVIAKKNKHIKINSFKDLNKYKIGVVHLDYGETLILETGVSQNNLEYVIYPFQNALKLSQDRIDLWVQDETVAKYVFESINVDQAEFETVYTLKEGSLSFALSKDVPDSTVKLLQKALDKVMASDKYKDIISKYK